MCGGVFVGSRSSRPILWTTLWKRDTCRKGVQVNCVAFASVSGYALAV